MNAAGIQTNRANVRIVWLKVTAEKRGAERHQSSIGASQRRPRLRAV
jgi:hypothetical protein